MQYSKDNKDKSNEKKRKEVVEYVTCRHELWNVKAIPETETIVEEVVNTVINTYALFGNNDDTSNHGTKNGTKKIVEGTVIVL